MQIPFLTLQRNRRRKKVPFRKIGFSCSLAIALLFLGLTLGMILGYTELVRDLPSLDVLPVWLDPVQGRLFQATTLYDRTGDHLILALQNPATASSQYLPLDPAQPDHLPQVLVDATLTALDQDFWEHSGFVLSQPGEPEIHPTLEQQFIFEVLLAQEIPGIRRGLRERLLAAQATERFGKKQILEWYLNTTRYGPWIFGADAAARAYFDKPAPQLTLAEAAYLVAMSEQPQADPWDTPQSVLKRQVEIIQQMQRQELISQSAAQTAIETELILAPELAASQTAHSFSEYVLAQLQARFPNQDFERGGWKIITTLDYDLQQQAYCTAQAISGRAEMNLNPEDTPTGTVCEAAQLLPTMAAQASEIPGNIEAAILIMDPNTGQILAMVGDVLTPRPAGTIINPVVYLSAFSRGISPGSLIWDIPDAQVETVSDRQLDTQYKGPIRIRTALVNDFNQPARTIYRQLGENVITVTANQLGLRITFSEESQTSANPMLDHSQVSLLDTTQAYGLFANLGILAGQITSSESISDTDRIDPVSVIRLEDHNQTVWLDWSRPETRPVITAQLAYIMNHVLSDETSRWQTLGHPNPLEIGRPAGAKIGTTETNQANWTVGYTPKIITGVWLGGTELGDKEIPTTLSAGVWHAIMQYANLDKPVESWETPPGINFVDVCDPSGYLPTAFCPTIVTEVFLAGSEPTQPDFLYRIFQVNRETGNLATVFTPPELVEDKIYMVVPAEASAWASESGLPTPPDSYDVIYMPASIENAQISEPEMFNHVGGKVDFLGTANGANFDYYRLQVGQGLNPQVWVQVKEDSDEPVENGLLGTWDSSELSGLYAIQLLVVGKDQRVDRAVIQVTVDNDPPAIQILNPVNDQEIDRSRETSLVLNTQVQDNLEVDRVEFFIDGKLLTTLTAPPFYIAWVPAVGEHTLIVNAFDLAGNESETAVRFTVK